MSRINVHLSWGFHWNAASCEPGNEFAAACAWNAHMSAMQIMAEEA
jgi:hypothetical protein